MSSLALIPSVVASPFAHSPALGSSAVALASAYAETARSPVRPWFPSFDQVPCVLKGTVHPPVLLFPSRAVAPMSSKLDSTPATAISPEKALPDAPSPFLDLPSTQEVQVVFPITGEVDKCINLRSHAGLLAVVGMWQDVRLSRVSFSLAITGEATIFQAALTRKAISGDAISIASAPTNVALRRTELTAGAMNLSMSVPQGVDPQLVGPLTVGGACHLTISFNGSKREYVAVTLHLEVGGTPRVVVDFQ